MPANSPQEPTKPRPLGLAFGATEAIYLLGLALLAAGVGLQWSVPLALLICGGILIITAFINARERDRGA